MQRLQDIKTGEVLRYILVGREHAKRLCIWATEGASWVRCQRDDIYCFGTKDCTKLNLKQNTLTFLWKQALVEREKGCT